MAFEPLPHDLVEPLVRHALLEDLGSEGDITTAAIVPPLRKWKGALVARKAGTIAGLAFAETAFHLVDASVVFDVVLEDGSRVAAGDVIARMVGPAAAILTGERVALNFLCHLSGIASETYRLVEAAKPYKARISCTRKTTPLLRAAEKYAVRAGGGINHRFGLYDAVLIKDNHIAVAGGVRAAVLKARAAVGPTLKVEVEVDTLEQLAEILDLPVNVVLLDNMNIEMLQKAVQMVNGSFVTEASGGVTLDTVAAIASTGVDIISVGAITHSAPILDIGLDEA